jgi:hypothetical protein
MPSQKRRLAQLTNVFHQNEWSQIKANCLWSPVINYSQTIQQVSNFVMLEKFSIFHFSCSGKINPCKTYRDLLLISRPLSTVFQKGAAPLIPLVAPSAPSTISKMENGKLFKFLIKKKFILHIYYLACVFKYHLYSLCFHLIDTLIHDLPHSREAH